MTGVRRDDRPFLCARAACAVAALGGEGDPRPLPGAGQRGLFGRGDRAALELPGEPPRFIHDCSAGCGSGEPVCGGDVLGRSPR